MDKGNIAYLSSLPEELIDTVCKHLLPKDIRSFRLTCRAIKEKSYHAFSVCYFKATQVMLTRESLQQLIEFANDKRFGPNIRELQICLVTFPEQATRRLNGHPLTKQELAEFESIPPIDKLVDATGISPSLHEEQEKYRRGLKRKRRRLYGQYMHDQNRLRRQGIDVKLLAEALSKLPSLESITLIGQIDEMRLPWGARKIKSNIGIWPPSIFLAYQSRNRLRPFYGDLMYDKDVVRSLQRFATHSMAVVFGALIRSGIRLKQSLKIEGTPYSFLVPEKVDSRRLFPAGTPGKTFAEEQINDLGPAFSGIQELSLRTFHYYNYQPHDFSLTDYAPLSWLDKLMAHFPELRVLSISGAERVQESNIFKQLVTTTFRHLRKLEIGDTCIRVEDIAPILHNHSATLEEFNIENSRPITTPKYVELLHGMVGLQALVAIDLIRGSSRSIQRRFHHDWTLDGMGMTRIHIQKSTPGAFQAALGKKIQDMEISTSNR